MNQPDSFALASYGDPESRKTWSGTPYNLVSAFRGLGYPVKCINSLTDNNLIKLSQLVMHKALYQTTSFRSGPAARAYAARAVERAVMAAGCRKVLHTSLHHLPLKDYPSGLEQYLYLDYTWDMELKFSLSNTSGEAREMSKDEQLVEDLNRAAYSQIKHFFCISECVKHNLVHHYGIPGAKISVVGTGINQEFMQPVPPKDYGKGEILFSSKIAGGWEYKGGALLLEAFRIARRQNPALKLTVVGQEQYLDLVKGTPGVTAYGYVSWDDLLGLFREATLYAMPALKEPWGLVYLEALACKTPVLGLNRLAFPEISGHGQYGFIAEEATPEGVAAALLEAVSDPERLQRKGEAGRERCAAYFTWDHVVSKIAAEMGVAPEAA